MYREIAEALRQRLGELPAGSAVPSEALLVAEYGVARNTVRRALSELDSEGLVETLPGRGRVVRTPGREATSGTLPAYRRIADDLRRDIESGKLALNARVPSEAVLRERYGVSRGTARQALRILEAAGLVGAVHGKGRFVHTAR
jgi:DNA-binding GntR family transcriptional regulator